MAPGTRKVKQKGERPAADLITACEYSNQDSALTLCQGRDRLRASGTREVYRYSKESQRL